MQFLAAFFQVLSDENILRIHMQLMSFMAIVLRCLNVYIKPTTTEQRTAIVDVSKKKKLFCFRWILWPKKFFV